MEKYIKFIVAAVLMIVATPSSAQKQQSYEKKQIQCCLKMVKDITSDKEAMAAYRKMSKEERLAFIEKRMQGYPCLQSKDNGNTATLGTMDSKQIAAQMDKLNNEDEWKCFLVEHGISEAQAVQIISMVKKELGKLDQNATEDEISNAIINAISKCDILHE